MYRPMYLQARLQHRSPNSTSTKETQPPRSASTSKSAGNAGATAADTKIVVKGDVKKVKYLGFKMSAGEMVIEGICRPVRRCLDDRWQDPCKGRCRRICRNCHEERRA